MKRITFILTFVCIAVCAHSQSLEAYPTSQRYMFNPYNRNNVAFDSLFYSGIIYTGSIADWYYDLNPNIYPFNEYQMYSASDSNPVQVYGVAIPIDINPLTTPTGHKSYGYYWESDNLGPYDESIRDCLWRLFVDSIHVMWSSTRFVDGCQWNISGERIIKEMYIYLIQKTDDLQRPIIITDSVRMDYGINATGWNRFQRPKVYDCPPPNNIAYPGGYIVPTLEVYFDHPHTLNDTFFVGNTVFAQSIERCGDSVVYNRVPPTYTSYLHDPSGCGYSGIFRSDNGEFIPRQTCAYYEDDPRWWRPASCPGAIDNSYMTNVWGGPMAIVAPPPCMVPNDVRMTQVGYDSATVEWNIPVGVSHCLLEYGPQGFAPGTGTRVDSLTEGRYCIHSLDEDTPYEVRISCWCIYAEEYSDTVSVGFRTTPVCPAVPEIHGSEVTDTTIALSWWIPDSADYTDVEYGLRGFVEGEGTLRPHITRGYYGYGSVMIGGLSPHTAYEVRLRNYCSGSDAMSAWYSFDTVTTGIDTTTEAVNSVLKANVVLRPNPASTSVTVSSPATITRMKVVDLQGRTLYDAPIMSSTAKIATADWPRGTVLVTVVTSQGVVTKKLTLK